MADFGPYNWGDVLSRYSALCREIPSGPLWRFAAVWGFRLMEKLGREDDDGLTLANWLSLGEITSGDMSDAWWLKMQSLWLPADTQYAGSAAWSSIQSVAMHTAEAASIKAHPDISDHRDCVEWTRAAKAVWEQALGEMEQLREIINAEQFMGFTLSYVDIEGECRPGWAVKRG